MICLPQPAAKPPKAVAHSLLSAVGYGKTKKQKASKTCGCSEIRPFKGGRGEGKVEARKKTTKPHKSCKGNCSPPPTNVHMPIQLLSNGCLQQLPPLLPPLPAVLQARCSAARSLWSAGSVALPVSPPSLSSESIPRGEARVCSKGGLGAVQALHRNVEAHQCLSRTVLVTNLKHSTTDCYETN